MGLRVKVRVRVRAKVRARAKARARARVRAGASQVGGVGVAVALPIMSSLGIFIAAPMTSNTCRAGASVGWYVVEPRRAEAGG